MMPPSLDPQQIIDTLERHHLDRVRPPVVPLWGQAQNTRWLRILGLARFWKTETSDTLERWTDYAQHMEDLIIGCNGQKMGIAYAILSGRGGVRIYLGLQGPNAEILLPAALRGTFPGVRLRGNFDDELAIALRDSPIFAWQGRLTGVPTLKAGGEDAQQRPLPSTQQIERLIRGLAGEDWGYLVLAQPLDEAQVLQMTTQGLTTIREVSGQVKRTVQTAQGVTGEYTDRTAQYCVELLERQLARLDQGKAAGMWRVEVYLGAPQEATLSRACALARSTFSGSNSRPEPIRTFRCAGKQMPGQADPFVTLLNSRELATLIQLPREEFPGYAVPEYARFDVDLPEPGVADRAVPVGKVLDGDVPTGGWYVVDRHDFAKHGLIVGVTGSGKTNTLFHLLDKLWAGGSGVPFLVIEPAKTEYRDLLSAPGFEHLRVFTLGDETVAPFRLNPFEFEIVDAEHRIHVQTHVDFLKSVFNAAFILYAPMPYVLEACLHEVYQDKGWDLTTGLNRRVPPVHRGKESQWPVFPTLSDLYRKIDEVADRLGYEERIQMDVKAGLKARIGSLRLGGKGLMLDVPHSLPMKDLLSQPTVLELERMGNDDEKAFVIGLILTRLYECRIVQARLSDRLPPLQHVTVFEEAHHLLKNVPTEVGTEEANTKGQAVETFANMLSEIRAYGQGVLIAEQIPTKLASDAIKNTNLKVLHRIVAADDREVMGRAMNLDEAQSRFVTALKTGQAAVYAEGADRPYLVALPDFKGRAVRARVKDAQVRQAMAAVLGAPMYDPWRGLGRFLSVLGPVAGDPHDSRLRDLGLDMVAHDQFLERFRRYTLSLLEDPRQAVYGLMELLQLVRQIKLRADEEKPVLLRVLFAGLDEWFDNRGRQYGWYYNVVEALRDDLAAVLADVVARYDNQQTVLDALAAEAATRLAGFIASYHQQCARNVGPFVGCIYCAARCVYRYDVAPFIADKALQREFMAIVQSVKDDQEMWQQLADASRQVAERLLIGASPDALRNVALCNTAQMGPALGFSTASQRKLAKNVREMLA
jgi:hypothetical protein